jgi:hypothetical protein
MFGTNKTFHLKSIQWLVFAKKMSHFIICGNLGADLFKLPGRPIHSEESYHNFSHLLRPES